VPHSTILTLVVTLLATIFLLKHWKAVLGLIAACLLALAIFGLLTLLALVSGR
jgi:hypothetical protein